MIDIDINGEKAHVFFDTGSDISFVSYEYYTKMGSPKLCSNDISLSGINKVIVYPKVGVHNLFSRKLFPTTKNLKVTFELFNSEVSVN